MSKLAICVAVGGVIWASAPAQAAEEKPARLRAGVVEVHPAVTLSSVYDDNVFKVSENGPFGVNPTADIYFTLNPRASARLPFGYRSYAAAGYGWQAVKYSGLLNDDGEGPDTTRWDTFNTHEVFGEFNLRTTGGLGFGVRNDLQRKNLFVTATELTIREPGELVPIGLYHNEFKPTVVYNLEERNMQFDVSYLLSTDRFAAERYQYLDKDIHVPRGRISYRFFPKTAGYLEGEGYLVRYQAPGVNADLVKSDADGWKGWLGVQGAITGRLSVLAAGGWGRLSYASGTASAANTWLARFELNEKFSERTRATLGASREFFDSYSTNYFVANRAYGELWRSLSPALAVVAGGNIFHNAYSEPFERTDRGFLASAKLEYTPHVLDWLKLSGGYNREHRQSDLDWFSYSTNQVFLEVGATL
jgi:hypothetical protein